MDYADFLDREMKKRGWSAGLLSELSGIPVPTIWRTLKGETKPNPTTRRALERAFGLEDKSQEPNDFVIMQNALLQCKGLSDYDKRELLELVKMKLKKSSEQYGHPDSEDYRGVVG